jgi:hypothetical protein
MNYYKPELPNATISVVLGAISIPSCICYGILGLPLAIIAVVFGRKAMNLYQENPNAYRGYDTAQAGYILGIIGIVFNGFYFLLIVMGVVTSLTASSLGY